MTMHHINKNGVPSVCKAKPGNCPYGGEGGCTSDKQDSCHLLTITAEIEQIAITIHAETLSKEIVS